MQLFIFLICLCCGIIAGVFYDVLYIARSLIFLRVCRRTPANTVAAAVCDLLTFAALAALYVLASVLFGFPNARFYMFFACFCGILLYIKSFHLLVAFLINKLYNRYTAENTRQ